ncbi:Dolichyl-diphosphooligosaccharide--protein glycosyltransferase subunit Swp1 [Stachybotrys elegans]|uniref:Dolichyl-diphosphooligosaccharide--protein glycosyltransferase subunit Swp1 n=1 Tax=Stachybotrys elegans TaxID=80388 RepID=A0A8K0SNL2_9HYPO|nr:Dolichyl-diphosphooligosaccharide--protein glycosyltransferase subunit Swp1 [Stachybotrys elegans]
MRFSIASSLLLLASAASAASSWGFSDAKVSVGTKSGDQATEKFTTTDRVKNAVAFGHKDTLKLSLTLKEGSKAKRPHQAFLVLKESSGLEAPFPLTLKATGAGAVEITHKDIPIQLLQSETPLEASLVIGSFGTSAGYASPVFDIDVVLDPNAPVVKPAPAIRYGKLNEIHHIFKPDAKSPPKVISAFFALAVLATIPAVFVGWAMLGGNVDHLQKALSTAPVSHAVFFGSIMAMEGVFFLYYTTWKLLDTLPFMLAIGGVAFLSGTKALGEVQSRRLAGER